MICALTAFLATANLSTSALNNHTLRGGLLPPYPFFITFNTSAEFLDAVFSCWSVFIFCPGAYLPLFCPSAYVSNFDESDGDDISFFEGYLPQGLLDSQERSPSPILAQGPFTQESLSFHSNNSVHSSLCADSEASPRLSHLDTPKTLIKNQSDGDSTQESSQSASLDHPSPPLFSFGNCPFKRHADLPEALSTLVYKSPLTTRTFYNEKNIPIYNGVYYGLSNSFKQYVYKSK